MSDRDSGRSAREPYGPSGGGPGPPTRVVVADDHALLRAALRVLLRGLEGVEVIAEAADGVTGLRLVAELRPDVLLTDIAMPGLNGLELAARVAAEFPETRVIVLSMHRDEVYVREAEKAGAAGFLPKDAEVEDLARALREVARGGTYLHHEAPARTPAAPGPDEPAEDRLTPRQRDVLRGIAEGQTTKAIARSLGVSAKTVETHRRMLMDRLGIHDVPGLVRYAVRIGLVRPEG